MTARQVHAAIAAGVDNPMLIESWQREPQLLRQIGVEPGDLNLTTLRKFAGLSTKVRHNGIRQWLPLSFRLLSVASMEIELFAAYGSHCAAIGHTFASTPFGRAADLVDFLGHWLDRTDDARAALWDIVRHEVALAVLARSVPPDTPISVEPPTRHLSATSVPVICGRILLHEMRCDPRELSQLLRQREPRLDAITLSQTFVGYWSIGIVGELSVLLLDEFSHTVLERVDGVRSSAQLCQQILGTEEATPTFLAALAQLADVGLLRFTAPSLRAAQ